MITRFRFVLVSLVALAVTSLPAIAQEDLINDPTVFVKGAVLGELTQIELAKLAQSTSHDAAVRSFAARMLEQHSAINKELGAIAARKGLDAPTSLDYEDEEMVKQGVGKSGAEFDAWYARLMRSEHQKAIALFEGATQMQDADLAAFAKKTLPALEEAQRMAASLPSAARH